MPARGAPVKGMNSQQAAAEKPDAVFELLSRCKAKGWGYWIGAAIVLIVATTGSHFVYEELRLEGLRELFFQTLAEWVPRPTEPRYTRLVLIEDDEYWKGELAGRRPIKRRYLAKLVADLAQANAHVIALDFDVRLPDPSSLAIPPDYVEETKVLIDAIKKAAASGVKIVLATPVSRKTRESTEYRRDSDIYQANRFVRSRPAERLRQPVRSEAATTTRSVKISPAAISPCRTTRLPFPARCRWSVRAISIPLRWPSRARSTATW